MSSITPNAAQDLAATFADDPRVYFNKVTGRWQFEDDDGKEMEWDIAKGSWTPVIDEELLRAQQAAYKVDGVDEDSIAAPVLEREAKKRKVNPIDGEVGGAARPKRGRAVKKDRFHQEDSPMADASTPAASTSTPVARPRQSKNTAVFVSGLPLDTTVDEIREAFSKFGLIEIDDNDDPKIKFYADPQSNFNGQALVVYFKEESVDLAIRMLDDAELRLGEPNTRMGVRKADFAHKAKDGTETVLMEKKEFKPRALDKKKATRRIGKMQSKLNDWDDEDGFGPSADAPTSASALALKGRVVVLKHMFTLRDLEKDVTLLLELKNDVREECETLGDVTNVVLYDQEADGVMTVKFRDAVSAQACIQKMNGRFFDGRKVTAELYTGKERFKKTGGGGDLLMDEEGDEGEKKRLDAFASWLEGKES